MTAFLKTHFQTVELRYDAPMGNTWGLAFAILVLAGVASGEGPSVTHVERMERAFDAVLQANAGRKRTLYLALDPSPSLRKSAVLASLRAAWSRHARKLSGLEVGVWSSGASSPALSPTTDRAAVENAVEVALGGAFAERDIFATLGVVAADLTKRRGSREVLLVSLENGDRFESLSASVKAVKRARVKVWIVAREAYLADPPAADGERRNNGLRVPGDARVVDVPWKWIGQYDAATSHTPSGYPCWAVSRFAVATKSRVFLYYPGAASYKCHAGVSTCPFCDGRQVPPEFPYVRAALRALAPAFGKSRAVVASMARDSTYQVLFRIWEKAAKAGLVYGLPPIRSGKAVPGLRGQLAPLGRQGSVKAEIDHVRKLVAECDKICVQLDRLVDKKKSASRSRPLAVLEYTRVMAHLTRLNLRYLEAYCREVGPRFFGERSVATGPEVPLRRPARVGGIMARPMTLGHGVSPYLHVRLPGGEEMDRELLAFRDVAHDFLARYARTPYAMAFRRAGITEWWYYGSGGDSGSASKRSGGSGDDAAETDSPSRRPASPSGGGGPSSGGG